MQYLLRPVRVSILVGVLSGSPAHAQQQKPVEIELGLAPSVGYFWYPQHVDGGYYLKGKPYELVWSGLQLQLSGDFHSQLHSHPFIALGVDAAFMVAPNATARDSKNTVSVDSEKLAFGGYLAFSSRFRLSAHWRLTFLTGFAKAGISGEMGFGGWGLIFGVATHHMFGSFPHSLGIGLRLNSMALRSSEEGMIRGESGWHLSVLLEVLYERLYSFVPDQTRPSPEAKANPVRQPSEGIVDW